MNPLVFLAKQSVENFVEEGKVIELPKDLSEEFLKRKAGTFVTIMKDGQLRG
ncbi:AMMECR1 domain-containing protein, partial [Candidatus Parcubacteria bacterium]|nr:AMMECR1 domain-containing protein [Candidatus Parcubacteria bacterium]